MTAIYARQSVERADSISIEQQIEYCTYEARGDNVNVYTDKGFSGKNTNRPQFSRMMADIRSGLINSVIVYKLDRISRSILDFSNMMQEFEKYRVQFISATEKFDTSSPMGKAMLNICIVFAQLERETIQKRVSDAYFSRSRRHFYMGGPIPFGFRKVPTVIDGVHTSMYEAVQDEAEQIRLIYELYSRSDTSLGDITERLRELGFRKRGKEWERPRIRDIIINPIYVRADIDVYNFFMKHGAELSDPPELFNGKNGCYSYKGKNENRKKSTYIEGNQVVIAPHEGIIESGLWLKCREKCLGQKQLGSLQKAKNSWLSGKIKCGECGYALLAKEFRNHKDRYLFCSHKLNAKSCKGAGLLYTDDIEQLIYNEIRKKLAEFPTLSGAVKCSGDSGISRLKLEASQAEYEISILMKRINDADDTLFRYINERISELDRRKSEIEKSINELMSKANTAVSEINNHLSVWSELSFDDKRRTAETLIEVIYASEEKIIIIWKI